MCNLQHIIWCLILGRKGRFGQKSVSALIHALASGPPFCQFKSLMFVFQLQFAIHESERWSRNHSVIKATSVNHQAQLQEERRAAAANHECFFTFDLWHKQRGCRKEKGGGGGEVPFMGVAWTQLIESDSAMRDNGCDVTLALTPLLLWRLTHCEQEVSDHLITCTVWPDGQEFDWESLSAIVPASGGKCFQTVLGVFALRPSSFLGCGRNRKLLTAALGPEGETVQKMMRLTRHVLSALQTLFGGSKLINRVAKKLRSWEEYPVWCAMPAVQR